MAFNTHYAKSWGNSVRNRSRARRYSLGDEVSDGIEQELGERYRLGAWMYISHLRQTLQISTNIYQDMLNNGVVDKLVDQKLREETIPNGAAIHGRKICYKYVRLQRILEMRTLRELGNRLDTMERKTTISTGSDGLEGIGIDGLSVPVPVPVSEVLCNPDLVQYISEFM